MKLSWIKLPALYGVLYWCFAAVMLAGAGAMAVAQGFSVGAVAKLLLAWQNQWWWLALVGLLLHVLAYAKSLRSVKLMVTNTIGTCAFVAYILIPNFMPIILVVHAVVLAVLIRHRSRVVSDPQGALR
ncbi:hypothetical protein [Lacticaseibacillus nasuensis]|uniref:Integral membrane protein n=1 Tax=Lacticaseibacillus nasuensis JCM 17158 TaxID=1291734 RepID=A0A0R1JPR3_9LACO|nr:hypothetical protein [Lacticaseibacillus nasuensis]KRK73413.1 hypothetical protein FD02_GL001272 [Lacticaseibacillus nasuensis JCM 17158]